jgi:Mg-chelatase subunit ChlD
VEFLVAPWADRAYLPITFEHPLLLVLLPALLAATWILWRPSHVYLPPVRRVAALALRLLVVSLVVAALAEPLLQLSASSLAVGVLLDRSDSIPPAAQMQEEQWLTSALASKAEDDQVAVITFAGDARIERPLSADPTPPVLADAPDLHTDRTDLAAAIRMGIGALPPGMARRLVLLTDGQQNQEQADEAAALASAAGVQLLIVPLTTQSGPEALVDGLGAPASVRQGNAFSVTAQIRSTDPSGATLHLLVDGNLAATEQVTLDPGENRFVMPLEPLQAGHHILQLQLEADADTLAENNTGGAYVVITGPPRVLLVEGSSDDGKFLGDALRAQGLQVDETDPQTALLDTQDLRSYAAVVLANLSVSALSTERVAALQNYVQSFGGGLLVTGGDQSFGPGGYTRTPIEDLLPVQMDLRGQSRSASTAVVLVIDNSGSMGDSVSGSNKMDLAKEAALGAAQSLGPYDQIGILAFDDNPRWAIQPQSAADLTPVEQAINSMQPGGGTAIYPALEAAYQGLLPVDARVKHIVLLTDGEAPSGPYDQLTQQMTNARITLSTISIGSDADVNLLQQLAQWGNGGYYDGNDPFNLPQLVLKDTQQVQRAAIVEQETRLQPVSSSPALTGIDIANLPALRGYVATTPKPQTTVDLASNQSDPVLSEWQYGLGHVIAWTSDVNNRWSSDWLNWQDFGRFWSQVLERVARPPDDPDRQVNVSVRGDQALITLDAQGNADDPQRRQYLNFLPTSATLVGPDGVPQQISLPQVAPGRYQATTPVDNNGVYQLDLQQTDLQTGSVAQQSGGFVVPYSPEYQAAGTNTDFLAALAQSSGGRVIQTPDEALAHDLPSAGQPQPLWPYLLGAAAVVMVFDVGVRRVRFDARGVRGQYAVLRERIGGVDMPLARRTANRRPTAVPQVPLVSETPAATARPATATRGSDRGSRLLAARQRARRG